LLLLAILDLIESGFLNSELIPLSAELTYQFLTYWRIVSHRRKSSPDVRMPFHHLAGDKLCHSLDAKLNPSPDRKLTRFIRLTGGTHDLFCDAGFRAEVRRILIVRYFQPGEQVTLAEILNIRESELGEKTIELATSDRDTAVRNGREVKFRLVVVSAYSFTCSLTRHRLTTITRGSMVDAAHIHQFADSRNNDPRNGIALSKNSHWMFDQGLWTINDDLTVKVAHSHFAEDNPFGRLLALYHGESLFVPDEEYLRPDPAHLEWHRRKKFLGAQ